MIYRKLIVMHQSFATTTPMGPGIMGDLARLKYCDFILEVSGQCHGYTGLLIPAKTAGEIAVCFTGF